MPLLLSSSSQMMDTALWTPSSTCASTTTSPSIVSLAAMRMRDWKTPSLLALLLVSDATIDAVLRSDMSTIKAYAASSAASTSASSSFRLPMCHSFCACISRSCSAE